MQPGSDVLLVGDLASTHVRRLATALRDHGLAISVACFEGDPIPGIQTLGLGSRPVQQDRRYATAIIPMARLLRQIRPRIVHAHYLSSYGVLAALALRIAFPLGRRPALVQTTWGTDLLVSARRSRVHRALGSFALRTADLMTGDSADLEAAACSLAPETSFHRFVFGPMQDLLHMGRRPDRIVLSTRRLDAEMRVDLAIAAFQRARKDDPEMEGWRMIVAAGGLQADALRRSTAGDQSIEFVGQLDHAALRDQLARAAVFVSVPVSDATSASLLESMAAGVVPVVNDLPANRQWVDASIGEVVPRDPSVEALAGGITSAAKRTVDPDRVRSAVREVTWEAEVARLLSVYWRLAAEPPR